MVMGVCSGWDSFLLKYGGEILHDRRIIFCMFNIILLKMRWPSIRRNLYLYLSVHFFYKKCHNYFNQFL